MSRSARLRRAAVLAVTAVALLSGCRLDTAVDVRVEADGSGEMTVTVGVDEVLDDRAAEAGVDPLGRLTQAVGATPGWAVEQLRSDTGERAVRLSTGFADADDLARVSTELADGLRAAELEPLQPFRLEVETRQLALRGRAGLQPTAAVRELGFDAEEAVARLRGTVDYRITVTMPGNVLETTGARLTDRTATWTVEPGETVDLHVVAERPLPEWLFAAVGVVTTVLLLALVGVVVARRRR